VRALIIDVSSRREAVDLLAQLRARNAYLVQLGADRWQVCIHLDEADGVLVELESAARRLAEERALSLVLRESPVPSAG
jgi:hypothetical protein